MTKTMIHHEHAENNKGNPQHKITTRLEGMTMRKKNVQGGDGYAAAIWATMDTKKTRRWGLGGADPVEHEKWPR